MTNRLHGTCNLSACCTMELKTMHSQNLRLKDDGGVGVPEGGKKNALRLNRGAHNSHFQAMGTKEESLEYE